MNLKRGTKNKNEYFFRLKYLKYFYRDQEQNIEIL